MKTWTHSAANDTELAEATSLVNTLLTLERALLGLLLIGLGASGALNLLPSSFIPRGVAGLGNTLLHAGIAYPLLKGIEVLLELYLKRRQARAYSVPAPSPTAVLRSTNVGARRGKPRTRRAAPLSQRWRGVSSQNERQSFAA